MITNAFNFTSKPSLTNNFGRKWPSCTWFSMTRTRSSNTWRDLNRWPWMRSSRCSKLGETVQTNVPSLCSKKVKNMFQWITSTDDLIKVTAIVPFAKCMDRHIYKTGVSVTRYGGVIRTVASKFQHPKVRGSYIILLTVNCI